MAKTYYLGKTASGAFVARASASDFGYTHAATFAKAAAGEVIPMSRANFSRSAQGALKLATQGNNAGKSPEIVALEVVDRATYKAATGKA